MTLAGTITYDTAGTLTLNGSGVRIMRYVPNVGAMGDEYVTETISLELTGANEAALGTLIGQLNSAMRCAYEYSLSQVGNPVYLYYQPDGYAEAWRSEIVARPGEGEAGRFQLAADAQDYHTWSEAHTIRGDLIVTRRNFWEPSADTQLPLTQVSEVDNTSGLSVYNSSDPSRYNYFDVGGTLVAGDLPAPVKIEITRPVGLGSIGAFYVSINDGKNALNWEHWSEATYDSIADAKRSSGNVSQVALDGAGTATYFYNIGDDLTGVLGDEGANLHITARARLSTGGGTATLRMTPYWRIRDDEAAPMGATTLFAPPSAAYYYRVDLGYLASPTGYADIGLKLEYSQAAGGTLLLDAVSICPTNCALTTYLPYLLAAEWTARIDEIRGKNVILDHGNTIDATFLTSGKLRLTPGHDHRVYLEWTAATIDSSDLTTDCVTVKMWYRPRRLSL